MLMSAGFPLPKKLFGHGFLTKDGEKMGKTRGNIIVPQELIDQFGVDAVRFYFLFNIPFGQDGDYSEQVFKETINAYLANRLGNLFSRVIKLIENHCESRIPLMPLDSNSPIAQKALGLSNKVKEHMENYEIHDALKSIFDFVDEMNLNLTEVKPWNLFKSEEKTDHQIAKLSLVETLEGLRIVSNLLYPFIPELSSKMLSVFSLKETNNWEELSKWSYLQTGMSIQNPGVLFGRLK